MKKKPIYDMDTIEKRFQRIDERYEVISRLLLGEEISGQPGLLKRQINDEKTQTDIMTTLHDIKKEVRLVKADILSLRDEFEWYRGVLKLPTTKKFWKIAGILIIILVILSGWTRDAYLFIWGFIQKKYL